jgi:hypothetical protein
MTEPAPPSETPPIARAGAGWQPLPRRSRALFLLGPVPAFALPAAAIAFVHARMWLVDPGLPLSPWLAALAGLLFGAAFGAWLGNKQYRYTTWRLDEHGLAVRRGRFWQRETRVPATRIQHLDLKRGPLQRRRSLATLVVHTAGTADSSVSVPNLDGDDAERLRERLSRQIEHDDE